MRREVKQWLSESLLLYMSDSGMYETARFLDKLMGISADILSTNPELSRPHNGSNPVQFAFRTEPGKTDILRDKLQETARENGFFGRTGKPHVGQLLFELSLRPDALATYWQKGSEDVGSDREI